PAGSLIGSIRHMTASIRLKIAVLAPMPNASDKTTAVVKPGRLPSTRSAKLTSRATDSSILTVHLVNTDAGVSQIVGRACANGVSSAGSRGIDGDDPTGFCEAGRDG